MTVGPRIKPVTLASISNCRNTSVNAATTSSLALLLAFAAGPVRNKSGAGSSYLTSAVNSNCSGRFTATVFSFECVMAGIDSSTGNSSSKLSSSNSSSSSLAGAFQAATTGDSKGGVSVISNLSSTLSARSGRFDQIQLPTDESFVKISFTGVAVITSTPKRARIMRTGYANTDVIRLTRGVDTAYPNQPPP